MTLSGVLVLSVEVHCCYRDPLPRPEVAIITTPDKPICFFSEPGSLAFLDLGFRLHKVPILSVLSAPLVSRLQGFEVQNPGP